MSMQQLLVPDIGDFQDVEIIELLVKNGEQIQVDEPLITLESDKAAMEIPSLHAGKIISLKIKVGDRVSKGDLIGEIEVQDTSEKQENNDIEVEENKQKSQREQTQDSNDIAINTTDKQVVESESQKIDTKKNTTATASFNNGFVNLDKQSITHASPSVRAFARKLGVNLNVVNATGPKNRITRDDIFNYVQQNTNGAANASVNNAIPEIKLPDFTKFGEVEVVKLNRIKKLSSTHLHAAWLNVPSVTQFESADITDLENFRSSIKSKYEALGVKVTPLAFVIIAVVNNLKQYPEFNSSLDMNSSSLLLKRYYNIGVAVNTINGLVVPVIKDADKKGIFEISQDLANLSQKARDSKLDSSDISGATFTISSLGGIGGTQFTPIVNAPEVAILGVSKSSMQPIWDGSNFAPRLMLPFSLSYDHRVIDGAQGAEFAKSLKEKLSNLNNLLL